MSTAIIGDYALVIYGGQQQQQQQQQSNNNAFDVQRTRDVKILQTF